MTTTITLPELVAAQLQRKATLHNRTVEALAIEYLVAALDEEAVEPVLSSAITDDDSELLAVVARIKATPPNPANIHPAKGNLAAVLRAIEQMEPEPGYDWQAEHELLRNAELELRALDRAKDIAEGRG